MNNNINISNNTNTNIINPDQNNSTNLNNTTRFISETYDKLSYFDLYGNSVIIFLLVTLFVFVVYSYCKIGITKEAIASDWTNQRCKPQNVLFAGFITKPEGKTAFQYTGENFQYCVQNILLNITSYALLPFQYATNSIVKLFNSLGTSIDAIRNVTTNVRGNVQIFSEDILQRVLNTLVPLQTVFLAVKDTFNKIQGVMVSGLYTMLGSYYTLQALMGAILELLIKMLIVLVAIIVGLWIMPFTWPAAASMTAVFLGISIPLAIIIHFMTDVLHVQASGIPKLRCFDKNVELRMADGSLKCIKDIQVGDQLEGKNKVTAKIKVTAKGLQMYKLNGVIVSESHIVNYRGIWVPIRNHPDAIKITSYQEPYLYCLNTSWKIISINDVIFTDWDELYNGSLEMVLHKINQDPNNIINNTILNDTNNIHKFLDDGYNKVTKIQFKNGSFRFIKDIQIGDIIEDINGKETMVYGIVEIDKNTIHKYKEESNLEKRNKLYHLLTNSGSFISNGKKANDYNFYIDSILHTNLGKWKSKL
uniref:Vint domain-containing protein n=1 Tax=viral metagenome TaxID=1070528 RepID=A0A6C0IRC3_9ZZZZ